MKMTRARLDGLYCLLFGSIVFIVLGVALVCSSKDPVVDFGVVYDPARCLIQHCLRLYSQGRGACYQRFQRDLQYIFLLSI